MTTNAKLSNAFSRAVNGHGIHWINHMHICKQLPHLRISSRHSSLHTTPSTLCVAWLLTPYVFHVCIYLLCMYWEHCRWWITLANVKWIWLVRMAKLNVVSWKAECVFTEYGVNLRIEIYWKHYVCWKRNVHFIHNAFLVLATVNGASITENRFIGISCTICVHQLWMMIRDENNEARPAAIAMSMLSLCIFRTFGGVLSRSDTLMSDVMRSFSFFYVFHWPYHSLVAVWMLVFDGDNNDVASEAEKNERWWNSSWQKLTSGNHIR